MGKSKVHPRQSHRRGGAVCDTRGLSTHDAAAVRRQSLLPVSGDGMLVLDTRDHVVSINAAGLALLARTEDEVLGTPGSNLLGEAAAPALQGVLQKVRAHGEGACISLDLQSGEKTLGVTLAAVPRDHGGPDTIVLLRDLTDLARQTRSLWAQATVARELSAQPDLEALLRQIVARAAHLFGGVRCAFFWVEEAGAQGRLRCLQARGVGEPLPENGPVTPGEAVVRRALDEGRTVWAADILQDPSLQASESLRMALGSEGIGGVLAAPIFLRDEAFGALAVYRPAGHRFLAAEVDLVTALAGFAAIAIEHARLYGRAQERLERIRGQHTAAQALMEVSQALTETLDLEMVFHLIAEKVLAVTGADFCGVARITPTGDLEYVRAAGFLARDLLYKTLRRGEGLMGRCLASGRPEWSRDLRTDPALTYRPETRAWLQIRGGLAAPIVTADGPYGALLIGRRTAHEHVPQEVALAEALANHAALAIQNAELFHREHVRRQQLEAVRAVTGEIIRELDLSALLGILNRRALELVGGSSGIVFLWDEAAQTLTPRAWHGLAEWVKEFSSRLGEGLAGVVAQRRAGLIVNDYRTWPQANARLLAETGITAALGEPLLYGDRLLGVIVLNHQEPQRRFAAKDREVLGLFAAHAAIAIENARLFHAARQAGQEIAALYEGAQAITENLDLETTLARIAERARDLSRAERTFVWLVEPHDGSLRAGIAVGPKAEAFRGERLPADSPAAAARAVREGQPIAVSDVSHSAVADPTLSARFENAALLAVPLRVQNAIPGVLVCGYDRPRGFSTADVDRLGRLASHAAAALQNARLFEDVQRRAREAAALAEVGRALSASLDMDSVLGLIVQHVQGVMGGSFVGILALDDARQELSYVRATGLIPEHLARMRLKVGEGIAGLAVAQGAPVQSARIMDDPRYLMPDLARAQGFGSLLCAPLVAGSRSLGALAVFRREEHAFSPAEIELLMRFADKAALALRNARLYAETRKAYEDLRTAQDQLVQTERIRALGTMAAGVAYDFNNILAVILGRAQLLSLKAADPELRRGFDVIKQAVQDGTQTVRGLLGFARTRPEGHHTSVDPAQLLAQVLEVTRPRWKDEAQARGTPVEAVLALDPVPPVLGDETELREALVNLVFNALDAMPQGGRLTLGARRVVRPAGGGEKPTSGAHPPGAAEAAPEFVEMFVQDTGGGMAEEVRRRAFEPFFTTKGAEGSGLGLAMVHGIVSRHGGKVCVDSGPGGTMVALRVPIADGCVKPPHEPPDVGAARPSHIVVVDDNMAVGETLSDLLQSQGHQVQAFTDPQEALEHLARAPADLLFTDLGMPGIRGWEVAQRALELRPDLLVILVTGWGDQVDLDQAARYGIKAVVGKPFRAEEVLRLVAELVPAREAT